MSAPEKKAVFLSYASQDAEAVQRIADALRAAGIEVWFDRNELVGGDAWDAKIRKQIAECTLFVPIISANTQARREGYFRLEWRLAAQRTHMMSESVAFLLPVVIDATRDAEADVPSEFKAVQWSRLGEARLEGDPALEKFCTRVKALLGGSAELQPALSSTERGLKHRATVPTQPSRPRWLVGALAGLVGLAAVGGWLWLRRPASAPVAETRRDASSTPAPAPLSEAQQLVAKARARIIPDRWQKGDFEAVSATLDRITQIDPENADVWALRSIINSLQVLRIIDPGTKPLEAGRAAAVHALRIAPKDPLSNVALGLHHVAMISRGGDSTVGREIIAQATANLPTDNFVRYARLVSCWLGYDFEGAQRHATEWLAVEPAASFPAWILASMSVTRRLPAEAEKWSRISVSDPDVTGLRTLSTLTEMQYYLRANLAEARAIINRASVTSSASPRIFFWRWLIAMAEEKWDDALQELARVPDAFLFDISYNGPKTLLAGLAHERAGRSDAAAAQFRDAERLLRERLTEDSDNEALRTMLAVTLASASRSEDARKELALVEPLVRSRAPTVYRGRLVVAIAQCYAAMKDYAAMALWLRKIFAEPSGLPFTPASVRLDPRFKAAADAPQIAAVLKEFASLDRAAAPSGAAGDRPAAAEKSLVVLPLENLSPDPENAFFTEGMHAQLIATLQRATDLRVFGRDTALAFKRGSTTIAEFAQRLGAANVLTGSVRRAGTKARILLELRRASDDALLWSSPDTERELTDTWAVQGEVAEQVARALKARESLGSNAHARYLTKNPQAFDLFVKADQRFFAGEFARAIPLYTESFALDSSYVAPAYMLAHAHCNLLFQSVDPAERLRAAAEARRWIEVVTRLDPTGFAAIAESHYASNVEEDNLRALEQAERGLRAIPNDTAAPTFHAVALEGLGRMAEALESYRRATQIDPLLVFSLSNEARVLTLLRRESEATAMAARINEVVGTNRPFDRTANWIAMMNFSLRGTLPKAIEQIPLPRERAQWLLRARRFAEAERAAAEAAKQTGIIDVVRFDALVLRHDALLRLNRPTDVAAAAAELLELARKLQATTEVGPPRKAGWLAVAEARAGHAEAAISAARRFVEDAVPRRQQAIRWQREISFAELYAYLNRPQECCELLAKLLRVPSGLTVPMLRADPTWDNMREEPAFKALLADPKNSAPL